MGRKGFTLVELVVVVVVIAAILAILIPILREKERQRLQTFADAEPWEVFEFRARPAKESFAEGDEIVVECEIVNRTGYPLTLPGNLDKFHIVFGDTNYFAGSVPPLDTLSGTDIAPGKSALFDVAFKPIGTGTAEVRIAYVKDIAVFVAGWRSISVMSTGSIILSAQGGAIQARNAKGIIGTKGNSIRISAWLFEKDGKGAMHFTQLRGMFTSNARRFQSDVFTLEVKKSGSSDLPTFDEIVLEIERLE